MVKDAKYGTVWQELQPHVCDMKWMCAVRDVVCQGHHSHVCDFVFYLIETLESPSVCALIANFNFIGGLYCPECCYWAKNPRNP